ncbi:MULTISPECIES: type II toxin-antitoxin system VapC family toxin [unclassified Bradyrhizobium]|uniref:type II toxin-antitoxin system VapC family toxin n=1 Tax=unclassified Bradyrhizobium TaxID=2631580 RepID=UPI001FF970C0|nr:MULTISPECIES: type II toxin-antitoxin system VapC family toxin [unclassified Bradyrhizobium]
MIIDTSALVAVLGEKSEAQRYALAIESHPIRRMSAANFVEAAVVIDGSRDPIASRRFDELMKEAQISIESVTEAQAQIAREAYRDFGKGSGHPAKLNFGDCFAYALAKSTGEPYCSRAMISSTPISFRLAPDDFCCNVCACSLVSDAGGKALSSGRAQSACDTCQARG